MILINIKMRIRPEKMNDWLALADSYARDVNAEDGCLFFQFARSLTDEDEFVCIEGFADAAAGAAHVSQPYRAGPGRGPAADHLHRHPARRLRPDGRDQAPLTGSGRMRLWE